MDIDIDDMEILEATNPCSPNLIPETTNREQPVEASESCPLKDLIKLEKPVGFEAANPPYNADEIRTYLGLFVLKIVKCQCFKYLKRLSYAVIVMPSYVSPFSLLFSCVLYFENPFYTCASL